MELQAAIYVASFFKVGVHARLILNLEHPPPNLIDHLQNPNPGMGGGGVFTLILMLFIIFLTYIFILQAPKRGGAPSIFNVLYVYLRKMSVTRKKK